MTGTLLEVTLELVSVAFIPFSHVPQGTPWKPAFHNAVVQVHKYFIGAIFGMKMSRRVFIEVHVEIIPKNLLISGSTGSSMTTYCSFDA